MSWALLPGTELQSGLPWTEGGGERCRAWVEWAFQKQMTHTGQQAGEGQVAQHWVQCLDSGDCLADGQGSERKGGLGVGVGSLWARGG